MAYLELYQGDADTITMTVTAGLSSLTGYSAKLYIKTKSGVEVATITGTISGLVATFPIVNDSSKSYTIGTHKFEGKLFDSSDHVYTPKGWKGVFRIMEALEEDPS